jgi:uncharacterized protein (DUF2236 family)
MFAAAALFDLVTASAGTMMQPPPGLEFDFSRPRGEPALVPAGSVSWRVFKNPVSLFVGGVAAVILELAEPSVRSGVWDHSSFRKDAVMRLRRTGAAAMMTVYGPRSAAENMIQRVVRLHDRVSGVTPDGTPYHANDDARLLDWVQATACYGFIEAYSRCVTPLSEAERSQAFAESAISAQLYGALGAPKSLKEWRALLARTGPQLERSEIIFEFLSIMRSAPILPRPLRPLQRLLIRAAVDLVPAALRDRLGLDHLRLSIPQRATVVMLAGIADRVPLRTAPPSQACVRMGLTPGFLYR